MVYRLLAGGLFAGFAAGLLAALLHFAFLQEIILTGEQYESGALVHLEPNAGAQGAAAPDHAHGAAEAQGFGRNALTVLFTCLVYSGYGLMLVAGFALAEALGHRTDAQAGLLWGIAGFAAFQLAPALGLPPELPGTVAADIAARQVWYFGTVLVTGLALALLAFGRGPLVWAAAAALFAAPHLIGAPEAGQYLGVAPPELAALFASRVLGVGLIVWAALGFVAGALWQRSAAAV